MSPSKNSIEKGLPMVQALLAWYQRHKRDLPWRGTQDPYPIWLSEIILQQTRVAQGTPYFYKFIETYPTVQALAAAPDQEVMRLWQGLGYYSRARNLLKAARLVADHGWPTTYEGLLKLPGVGQYTAAAIGSFAFGIAEPVVDGNVIRVIARLYKVERDVTQPSTVSEIRAIGRAIIPKESPADFNQAIMEFGAIQCTPQNPACLVCPLQNWCEAFALGLQEDLPHKAPKADKKVRYFHYLALEDDKGRIAMRQRVGPGIWQGLFEPMLIEVESQNEAPDFTALVPGIEYEPTPIWRATHILSHQRLEICFYKGKPLNSFPLPQPYQYFTMDEVESLAKPIVIVKLLEVLYPNK